MQCPYCQTENRDDREDCYYCQKDLSMLRLIVNKAKHHYNQGLEYAERNRPDEALRELENAVELDASLANAHVVMGTIHAQKDDFKRAAECWNRALALDHRFEKAHGYLAKLPQVKHNMPVLRQLRIVSGVLGVLLILAAGALVIIPKGGVSAGDKAKLDALVVVNDAKDGPDAAVKLTAMIKARDFSKSDRRDIKNLAEMLNGGAVPSDDDATSATTKTKGPSPATLKLELAVKTLKAGQPLEAAKALQLAAKEKMTAEQAMQAKTLRADAEKAAVEQVKTEAAAYFDRKLDYPAFEKTTNDFISLFASSPDLGVVTGLLDKVGKDHLIQGSKLSEADASAAWDWFEERDGKFEDLRVTKDEAKHAVEIHERLIAAYPKRQGRILFYTAMAYYKLDQKDKAKACLESILKDTPKSNAVKDATAFLESKFGAAKPAPKPAESAPVKLAPVKN